MEEKSGSSQEARSTPGTLQEHPRRFLDICSGGTFHYALFGFLIFNFSVGRGQKKATEKTSVG